MYQNDRKIPFDYRIRKLLIFIFFYIIFYFYLDYIVGNNIELSYLLNSLIFVIFILTAFRAKGQDILLCSYFLGCSLDFL